MALGLNFNLLDGEELPLLNSPQQYRNNSGLNRARRSFELSETAIHPLAPPKIKNKSRRIVLRQNFYGCDQGNDNGLAPPDGSTPSP
jgi:hypothetical protein